MPESPTPIRGDARGLIRGRRAALRRSRSPCRRGRRPGRWPLAPWIAGAIACGACAPPELPGQRQWTDHGTVLEAGEPGRWDRFLWGGFAAAVIKIDGTFHLYYQGSRGYDEVEGTVVGRAIGLATSRDGIRFTKHPDNPLITFAPQAMGEEGAVSAAPALDAAGEMVFYYGANSAIDASQVNADARLATSRDGIEFIDRGVVLGHAEPSVWGSGDELFPIIARRGPRRWLVYYIPNGTPQRGRLGVAWSERRDGPYRSAGVRDRWGEIEVWGMGSQVTTPGGETVLFLSNLRKRTIEARVADPVRPERIGRRLVSYSFENALGGVVYLDAASRRWLLYYLAEDNRIGVRSAPMAAPG